MTNEEQFASLPSYALEALLQEAAASRLWSDLREILRAKFEEFNLMLGRSAAKWQSPDAREFSVSVDGERRMTALYIQELRNVLFDFSPPCTPLPDLKIVVTDGKATFADCTSGCNLTTKDVVSTVLANFLGRDWWKH